MSTPENQSRILAEIQAKPQRSVLPMLIAMVSAPLMMGVAAFAVVQVERSVPTVVQTDVVQTLALPHLAAGSVDAFWREERIQPGDTLGAVLSRLGVTDTAAQAFIQTRPELADLRQLRNGRVIDVQTSQTGELISLTYINGNDERVSLTQKNKAFNVSVEKLALERGTAQAVGTISYSLFGATDALGLPDDVATSLADIFGSEINFHSGLRKGDRFKVVYETFSYQGRVIRYGGIVAAEFQNQGHLYQAIAFTDPSGRTNYYTPEGDSLKKAFLACPLPFTRITSGFSMRFHPILKKWKTHKGVDFGAPTGTPVKVTADGVVAFVGQKTGYGNVVEVKHYGQYSTLYAHLSAFAKGLRVGKHVLQSDLIAYVGSTGWATGPHLHYEFKVAGVQRNPLSEVVPKAHPMDKKYLSQFQVEAGHWVQAMSTLQTAWLTSAE